MGQSIKWLIDQRVIFLELFDILTLSEARAVSEEIREYVASGEAPVHLIVEMRKLLLSPSNLQINQEMTSPYLNHPNMGWVIVIGGNKVTQFVSSVLSRLLTFKLKHVDNYEQAISVLIEIDLSLNESMIE